MKRLRICFPAWLLAAWLAGVPAAPGQLAASVNYALQRGSFTQGIPDVTAPPASANYRLVEGNLGDLSAAAVTSANYIHHPGYLVPQDTVYDRPNLVSIALKSGRVWLEWTAIPQAGYYTVESATGTNKYMPVESVAGRNHWDGPAPVLTSRFYRIHAYP